jgi:hypothetical protein
MGLGEAREAARAARLRLRTGAGATLRGLLDTYEPHNEHRLRKWAVMRRLIERVFSDHLETPCHRLTVASLQRTIDAYPARSTAHRTIGYLRPILKWGRVRKNYRP